MIHLRKVFLFFSFIELRHRGRVTTVVLWTIIACEHSFTSVRRRSRNKNCDKCCKDAVRVYYYQLKYKVSSQALALDDDGLYTERVETLLTRLQLRGSIYATPERAEDIAAMIIEQVRSELLMVIVRDLKWYYDDNEGDHDDDCIGIGDDDRHDDW